MRLYELLSEALPLSKAMKYRKAWPKEIQDRYEQIFKHYANDDKGFRIYFPMSNKNPKPIKAPIDIERALADKGYKVLDYIKGLAVDKNNRQMKIGKVIRDTPVPLKKFVNDKRRAATQKEYMTVISRHPYDIAGMSTGRGWTSCFDLVTGENKRYVMADVKKGTIIAYLTTTDDPEIKNPVGRILIKPFVNTKSGTGRGKVIDFILVSDTKAQGHVNPEFKRIIDKWLKEINVDKAAGMYCRSSGLYADWSTAPIEIISKSDEELYAAIIKDPTLLQTTKANARIKGLPIKKLLVLLDRKPILIRWLSTKEQNKVLDTHGKFIDKMKDPTMAQISIAARTHHAALKKIKWDELSEKDIAKIIKKQTKMGRNVIQYIPNPAPSMILAAILNDPWGQWLSDDTNIFTAVTVLSMKDWQIVLDKHPDNIGWFIPGYMDYIKKGISISNADKEKLMDYVFNKLDSKQLAKLITTLIDDWDVKFPYDTTMKLLNKFPSLVEVFDWAQYDFPSRILNKISDYILTLNPNKIEDLFLEVTDGMVQVPGTYVPASIAFKALDKYPGLFFKFQWSEDDANIIAPKVYMPRTLSNKIANYALKKVSAYNLEMHDISLLYLEKNMSKKLWKKLEKKAPYIGKDY